MKKNTLPTQSPRCSGRLQAPFSLRCAAVLLCTVLLCATFACALPVGVSAAEAGSTSLHAEISENGQYIILSATLSAELLSAMGEERLRLFSIAPQDAAKPLSQLTALKDDIVPQADLSLRAACEGNLYSAFVLAAPDGEGGFRELCTRAYISNFDMLAQHTYDYPADVTKKGLDYSLFTDAQLLGSGHTVITFPLNEYLCSYSDAVIAYRYGSSTYYFNSAKISLLDHKIKICSDAGMRVYLNLVLTEKTDSLPEALGCLYFENAAKGAEYYSVNTDTSDAVGYLCAAVDFLMNRYTKPDSGGGFCGSIIFGYEVNSNRNTGSAGNLALSEYTAAYVRAFRLVDAAARSVYSNARVYISLANNYTVPSKTADADATLDYAARDFLDMFASVVSDGGDLPWRVAVNPYNVSLSNALFTDESSDGYITMNNIAELTNYLSGTRFLYNGQRRSVLISEVAYTSGDNSDTRQKLQAAAFALAYYKAEANDLIEGIIWKAQVDSSADVENLGLWTRDAGSTSSPDTKKEIYTVYKYIDTASSRAVCEMYLSLYGISSWGEAVSGYSVSGQEKRAVFSGTGTTDANTSGLFSETLYSFKSDSEGFYPSDNALSIMVGSDDAAGDRYGSASVLKATGGTVAFCEYRGISNAYSEPLNLTGTKLLKLSALASAPEGAYSVDLLLLLAGTDGNGKKIVYEGAAQLVPGSFYDLYFDVSEFLESCGGSIDLMKVWIKPTESGSNGELTLTLHEISRCTTTRINGAAHTVKVVLGVIFGVIGLIALILLALYVRAALLARRRKKRRAQRKVNKGEGVVKDLLPHKKNDTNDYE